MLRLGVREADTFRDQIAKATLRLVADRGTDQMTTSDVVKTMGITRAMMARHCPTEDDLWLAVTDMIKQHMTQAWLAVSTNGSSPSTRLRNLVAVQVSVIMEVSALRAMLLSGKLDVDNAALREGLCEIRQAFIGLLIAVLTEGQRTGEFRQGLHARATANFIVEALQGTIVSYSLNRQVGDPVTQVWGWLDAFVHETTHNPQVGPIDRSQRRPVVKRR